MLILIGLSGCGGIPVKQDYDSSTRIQMASTFQWLPAPQQTEPTAESLKKSDPFLATRIEKAIQNHLTQRGAQFVQSAPQAYISYHYTLSQTKALVPSNTLGFGMMSRNVGFGTAFPRDYVTEVVEEAKWVIDVHNAQGQLIWRGEAHTGVERPANPKDSDIITQRNVDAILSQYPPR
ncbi:DUF4136 domain-containing protein [Thiomicrorhabdus aquaedulcis]|uniref:DUF4136 domain-containing protein n=1 Tax=Thiomicrorhabdus aquaedulcis TaxID=2211106 RepID=UPI00156215BA|nr:DUF4136 domain-containing protein [Thiomicrorhabdus aquaedulcis]